MWGINAEIVELLERYGKVLKGHLLDETAGEFKS